MKKVLFFLSTLFYLTSNSFSLTACNDEYLEITNEDMRDPNGVPGNKDKLDTLAFFFIYELSESEKPKVSIDRFHWTWNWNLNNRKKITGTNKASYDNYYEYWKITIQKIKYKNIFVSEYKKSYEYI